MTQLFQQLSSFLPRQGDVRSGAGAATTRRNAKALVTKVYTPLLKIAAKKKKTNALNKQTNKKKVNQDKITPSFAFRAPFNEEIAEDSSRIRLVHFSIFSTRDQPPLLQVVFGYETFVHHRSNDAMLLPLLLRLNPPSLEKLLS